MASIFTYDPDPPRVASPWLRGANASPTQPQAPEEITVSDDHDTDSQSFAWNDSSGVTTKVTRLQAEPQEGPVEYKLHLLLRPRRKFRSTSTGSYVSGSQHSHLAGGGGVSPAARNASDSVVDAGGAHSPGNGTPPPQASMQQTRQHRLEQLTTQLLWRLQQSSPHHSSSATNIILPSLPEALPELQAPQQPAKLLHGLEESQGALYEIGVSDDGTLVGLTADELQESLNNLRAMAACLGCTVEILRREIVGECEWLEEVVLGRKMHQVRRSGKLLVAEALIKPLLQPNSPLLQGKDAMQHGDISTASTTTTTTTTTMPTGDGNAPSESTSLTTEQLRITLTGPTMSGKSTLLGTLTMSTLDNGRGKSRLSMLRHRHEITTGITSSVTQELLGYQKGSESNVEVVNYATENTASWIDIHVASAGSRLVFISDSAGHPRYRRTTLRGLVGWAPHWTLLCVPADDTEETISMGTSGIGGNGNGNGNSSSNSSSSIIINASPAMRGAAVSEMDLSGAQLDLCLRLGLPLVVVITKLDLASRGGLRESLSKVLDALKAAHRKPVILPNAPGTVAEEALQLIDSTLLASVSDAAVPLRNAPRATVPIVLTSAVGGTGIRTLHALLHELPIPDLPFGQDTFSPQPPGLFDIEDVYNKPGEVTGVVVSGRVRSGPISVGDVLLIGPFSGHDHHEEADDADERRFRKRTSQPTTSRSFPGALRDSHMNPPFSTLPNQEWRRVSVSSVRNLRLPVHSLHGDQIGTMAIIPAEHCRSDAATAAAAAAATILQSGGDGVANRDTSAFLSRIRKGMVLASIQPLASRTFTARFHREDLETLAVGNHVVLYIRSVRASAKVISASAPDSPDLSPTYRRQSGGQEQDAFTFDDFTIDDDDEDEEEEGKDTKGRQRPAPVAGAITTSHLLVTFSFDAAKEVVTPGDRVLVMPGGGPGLYGGHERGEKGMAGLEGFVGEVVSVAQQRA